MSKSNKKTKNPIYKNLLTFINDTKKGKYTDQKPDITQVTYKRLLVQEQDEVHEVGDPNKEIILFGIS